MPRQDVAERVRTLASSENRHEVLAIVCSDGPMGRESIERRVDASERMIKRALGTLAEQGYIRQNGGRYGVTAIGRFVYDAHRSFRDSIALAERLDPVLGRIRDGEFALDPAELAGATVRTADDGSPYRSLERVLELRRGADRIRELSTVVEERSVEQLGDRIDAGDDVEFVLDADAAESARSVEAYRSVHRSILGSDAVEGYVYEGSFPFVLGIFDDTVVVGTDQDGLPQAMLESDAPVVREWAEETYAEYRRSATPLPG